MRAGVCGGCRHRPRSGRGHPPGVRRAGHAPRQPTRQTLRCGAEGQGHGGWRLVGARRRSAWSAAGAAWLGRRRWTGASIWRTRSRAGDLCRCDRADGGPAVWWAGRAGRPGRDARGSGVSGIGAGAAGIGSRSCTRSRSAARSRSRRCGPLAGSESGLAVRALVGGVPGPGDRDGARYRRHRHARVARTATHRARTCGGEARSRPTHPPLCQAG